MLEARRKTSDFNLPVVRYALRFLTSTAMGRVYFAVALLIVWEAIAAAGWVSPIILAAPSRAFASLWKGVLAGDLVSALLTTAYEIGAGFLASALLGLAVGYFLWRFETLGRACEPFLGAAFATPTILLYPIFLVFFGRTEWVPIVMGGMLGIFPVVINTQAGLSNIKPIYIKRGRSLGSTGYQIFSKILLPAAAPVIFSGLKLGLMYVMIGTTAVEFLVEVGGLGKLISSTYMTFKVADMYGYIFVVVAIVVVMVEILNKVEKRVR
ncbi:MAG: ABC transporter permease subunit [Chloroflexi bacterium]|nr:ABC transporter permease subunit [Chloroflexota bacterium]